MNFFFADDGLKETDIESKTQSDGVTSLSINGCGPFEGGNVASFRVEITISPSQKLPDCDNGERFFEFVFDEKSKKKITKLTMVDFVFCFCLFGFFFFFGGGGGGVGLTSL